MCLAADLCEVWRWRFVFWFYLTSDDFDIAHAKRLHQSSVKSPFIAVALTAFLVWSAGLSFQYCTELAWWSRPATGVASFRVDLWNTVCPNWPVLKRRSKMIRSGSFCSDVLKRVNLDTWIEHFAKSIGAFWSDQIEKRIPIRSRFRTGPSLSLCWPPHLYLPYVVSIMSRNARFLSKIPRYLQITIERGLDFF